MINNSILINKLKEFSYYENKLPLYLKNSYGFIEHFRLWYDLLVSDARLTQESNNITVTSIVNTIDALFEILNIFDLNCSIEHQSSYLKNEDYLNTLTKLNNSSSADILNKIGNLFGLKRQFSAIVTNIDAEIPFTTEMQFNLNNKDFLMLIKCAIIKNHFNGSYLDLYNYYDMVGLPVFILNDPDPAKCNLHLIEFQNNTIYSQSEDVKNMFRAGMLTIQSDGIEYSYYVHPIINVAMFDLSEFNDNRQGFGA